MSKKLKIIVVFKTHFDIGYTELPNEALKKYSGVMLSDVLQSIEGLSLSEKNLQYVWTMPSWPLIQSVSPDRANPETLEKAKKYLKSGNIRWHALPFTTHTEFCSLEELVHGLHFSEQLSETYGFKPISAKMTDVPGHTWILPSLLFKAGIRFLHLGCNPGCTPPDIPTLFFWEGPDGNRLLTFYSKGSYGTDLTPPEDWPFPVWLALLQTGDNHGPQSPEDVKRILESIREKEPQAEVTIGTMDDFYNDLSNHSLDTLPIVRKDLADTWIHGIGSYPKEVALLRMYRQTLVQTEQALTLQRWFKKIRKSDADELQSLLDKAYEKSLVFGEHTWGLDVKTTLGHDRPYEKKEFVKSRSNPKNLYMEQSWKEQASLISSTGEILEKVTGELSKSCNTMKLSKQDSVLVFNGIGWKRNAWCTFNIPKGNGEYLSLYDSKADETYPLSMTGSSLNAYIKDLPACGFKVLKIIKHPQPLNQKTNVHADSKIGVLENSWFRITCNPQGGGITSLKDKRTGKEWVGRHNGSILGEYRYDVYGIDEITEFIRSYTYRFYDWLVNDLGRVSYPKQKHHTFTMEKFDITELKSQGCASLVLNGRIDDTSVHEYGNAKNVSITITLYDYIPYIDMTFDLKDKQATPIIESGHFVFPLNLENYQVRINKLGCVINPASDIAKDANHEIYCCESWMDVFNEEVGMAIIPLHTPLFSIGEPGILKFSRKNHQKAPAFYFNAFNNSWGTNFPQWMEGDYSFRYRLVPHTGNWQDASISKIASETMSSPLTFFCPTDNTKNEEPTGLSELIKDLEGMEILRFKKAKTSFAYVLRIREMYGQTGKRMLRFAENLEKIGICDLLENNVTNMHHDTNTFEFETKPYEIHTFLLWPKH